MEKYFKTISIVEELIEKGYNGENNYDKLVDLFMKDKKVSMDVILMLYGRFYMKNKRERNYKLDKFPAIIKVIENYYQKPEKLVSLFYADKWVVLQLISNYIKNGSVNKADLDAICKLGKEEIIKVLDENYNLISIDYINDIVRNEIVTKVIFIDQLGFAPAIGFVQFTNVPKYWIPIILSDAYIASKYFVKKDTDFVMLLEKNDFQNLAQMFYSNPMFHAKTIHYMYMLNVMPNELFVKLFDKAKNNKNIERLNPFYGFDQIIVENKRKALKYK